MAIFHGFFLLLFIICIVTLIIILGIFLIMYSQHCLIQKPLLPIHTGHITNTDISLPLKHKNNTAYVKPTGSRQLNQP